MIKAELDKRNGTKGTTITLMGSKEELFHEFRAIFSMIADNDELNRIATDALNSLEHDAIIKNFKGDK